VFTSIVEFALLIEKNQDDSVPHDRCKELWNTLKNNGLISVNFNDRKWAVCREELAKLGIIVITDKNYCTGKAMRWNTGRYFPGLGQWKIKKSTSLGKCNLQKSRWKMTFTSNNTAYPGTPS
jgi:hypothetical protein